MQDFSCSPAHATHNLVLIFKAPIKRVKMHQRLNAEVKQIDSGEGFRNGGSREMADKPQTKQNCREGKVRQRRQMCSTAGGSQSIFGLAGKQEKLKIARTSSEDVACSELLVGRDLTSITSGTQDYLGSVTSLTGEGSVPPPLGLQKRASEFWCWYR